MKAILMSIHPQWCELIVSGKKMMELRKTVPKEVPFKVYIYQIQKHWIYKLLPWLKERRQKVIGEFICDKVDKFEAEFSNNGGHEEICQVWFKDGEEIHSIETGNWLEDPSDCYLCDRSRLSYDEIRKYIGVKQPHDISVFYGLHISNIKIYDEPKELGDFRLCNKCECGPIERCRRHEYSCDGSYKFTRAPQSYCYVEDLDNE